MENLYEWIRNVFIYLNASNSDESIKIIENCGRTCAKSHKLQEEALNIRSGVTDKNNLNLLFEVYKDKAYNSPRLHKEGNIIYLEYHQCGCPLVNSGQIKDPLFCNCTRGYTKARFETLFDMPVKVILEKSILKGDNICKQKIIVDGITTE
jgi:hypothetical protein